MVIVQPFIVVPIIVGLTFGPELQVLLIVELGVKLKPIIVLNLMLIPELELKPKLALKVVPIDQQHLVKPPFELVLMLQHQLMLELKQ